MSLDSNLALVDQGMTELLVLLRNFRHDHLVKLYGVSTQQGPIFIVTELMVNGKFPLSQQMPSSFINPHPTSLLPRSFLLSLSPLPPSLPPSVFLPSPLPSCSSPLSPLSSPHSLSRLLASVPSSAKGTGGEDRCDFRHGYPDMRCHEIP